MIGTNACDGKPLLLEQACDGKPQPFGAFGGIYIDLYLSIKCMAKIGIVAL